MLKRVKKEVAKIIGLSFRELDMVLSGHPKSDNRQQVSPEEEVTLVSLVDVQSRICHDGAAMFHPEDPDREYIFQMRLAACRRYTGLSQEQLGDAIGVSREAVSQWEKRPDNKMRPSQTHRENICKKLNIPLSYLDEGKLEGVLPNLPIGKRIGKSQEASSAKLMGAQLKNKLFPASEAEAIELLTAPDVARYAREAGGFWVFNKKREGEFHEWGSGSVKVEAPKARWESSMNAKLEAAIEAGIANGVTTTEIWRAFCAECDATGQPSPAKQTVFAARRRIEARQKG